MTRETWLNGWHRLHGTGNQPSTGVLIGTGVHCVGCGKFNGVTTVAISLDWVPPVEDPDWPFDEVTCPVCWLSDHWVPPSQAEPTPWPKGKPRALP